MPKKHKQKEGFYLSFIKHELNNKQVFAGHDDKNILKW
jgi:hypothetical protein